MVISGLFSARFRTCDCSLETMVALHCGS
uniref:Uncharacterized protein n=1 Tax=Arundo donax TaxID=35708 RepID=A0A0A8XYF3_ARUDO